MKKITLLITVLTFGIMSASAFDRNHNIDGVYYTGNKYGTMYALAVSGNFMTIYENPIAWFDTVSSKCAVDVCHITAEGNNIYNITSTKPLGERVFKNIKIEQDDILPDSITNVEEDDEEDEINYIKVDFIFPFDIYQNDVIQVWGFGSKKDIFFDEIHVDHSEIVKSDTTTIYLPKYTRRFEFATLIYESAFFNGKRMGYGMLRYPENIKVQKRHITIHIPNYDRCDEYEVQDEYFKVLYPGVIRWRGVLFYRFDSEEALREFQKGY